MIFSTNPSVDVSYSDATTGAKQIKLLGLSGTYVQMMGETLPDFRGAALPFALDYVPGPWMKSIQVSKECQHLRRHQEPLRSQLRRQHTLEREAEHGTSAAWRKRLG